MFDTFQILVSSIIAVTFIHDIMNMVSPTLMSPNVTTSFDNKNNIFGLIFVQCTVQRKIFEGCKFHKFCCFPSKQENYFCEN